MICTGRPRRRQIFVRRRPRGDDSPGLRDYISDVVRRTVRETFGSYSREQSRIEKERVEQFRALLDGEIAVSQTHIESALDRQVDQKLKSYAKVHDVLTFQHEFQSTRPAPKDQAKEEQTFFEEILPSYHRRKLTPYFDAEVVSPDRDLGPAVPGLSPIVSSDNRFAKVVNYRRYRFIDTGSTSRPDITRNYGKRTATSDTI